MPEDIATISSKSDFDRCRDFRVIKATKYMWIGETGCLSNACGKEGITPQP